MSMYVSDQAAKLIEALGPRVERVYLSGSSQYVWVANPDRPTQPIKVRFADHPQGPRDFQFSDINVQVQQGETWTKAACQLGIEIAPEASGWARYNFDSAVHGLARIMASRVACSNREWNRLRLQTQLDGWCDALGYWAARLGGAQ